SKSRKGKGKSRNRKPSAAVAPSKEGDGRTAAAGRQHLQRSTSVSRTADTKERNNNITTKDDGDFLLTFSASRSLRRSSSVPTRRKDPSFKDLQLTKDLTSAPPPEFADGVSSDPSPSTSLEAPPPPNDITISS